MKGPFLTYGPDMRIKSVTRRIDAVNRALHRLRHRKRRVIAVSSLGHRYTLKALEWPLHDHGVALERWSYCRFLSAKRLPFAVWILTDFDRVHPWILEVAGRFYDRLVAAGCPVLNDPRLALGRAALLRQLHAQGINRFTCWLPALGERPARFPVFLRTLAAHRGVLTDLLPDAPAAEAALALAIRQGHPLADLAFIEYAAEPEGESGVFRKHACHIVGDRIVRALTVTDASWVAKNGVLGAATAAEYASDRAEMDAYPHEALMRRVFALTGTRFGRIDFGMVDGHPQIYELNTNPYIAFDGNHPNADRMATQSIIRTRLVNALVDLIPPPGRSVNVADVISRRARARRTWGQP